MMMKLIDDRLTQEMMLPAHKGDAGIDLYACVHNVEKLFPGEVKKFPSGVKVAIPEGWVGLVFPKSGKGSDGMHLANVTGVIDSPYRGQVFIKIKNNSGNDHEMMTVKPMEAVAQMVVVPHYEYEKMVFTDGELPETTRGEGGFNSTQR